MPKSILRQNFDPILTAIQKKYWAFDANEKDRLIQSDPLHLSWPEMLRLNHLCCLEMLETDLGQTYLQDPDAYGRDFHKGRGLDLARSLKSDFWPDLLKKLVSSNSPYRPRHCLVWQGSLDDDKQREPDLAGLFMNASVTHLGSFEVIKVDADLKPTELTFIGLDEISHLMFGGSGLFRAAKLINDEEREGEIVWIPLLYGVSWKCPETHDRDGSFTRFVGITELEIKGMGTSFGIGIGHQDLFMTEVDNPEVREVFGIGSIGQITVGLDSDDPNFEDI